MSLLSAGGHVANRTLEVPRARGADDPWAATRWLAHRPADKNFKSDNGRQCWRNYRQGNMLPADVATLLTAQPNQCCQLFGTQTK